MDWNWTHYYQQESAMAHRPSLRSHENCTIVTMRRKASGCSCHVILETNWKNAIMYSAIAIQDSQQTDARVQQRITYVIVRSASFTVLLSPSKANICHRWSRTSRSLRRSSSSYVSFSPRASRIAAADPLGRLAGEMVNSVLKEDAERCPPVCFVDVLIEVMAWDVDVRASVDIINCLSLA